MQALTRDDVPVTISNDDVDVRTSEFGDMTVSFIRLRKGTDLGPALVGLPGDLCQCPHWGYMLSGRLKMRSDRGDSTYEAGQAFYWAPGHAPVALEDCAYVDFSPTDEFSPVLEHLSGG
jgi:hypothetical protein